MARQHKIPPTEKNRNANPATKNTWYKVKYIMTNTKYRKPLP